MTKRPKTLRPVHPNIGIQAAYRRKLLALVDQMGKSYARNIAAFWNSSTPVLAQDASPSRELEREVRGLGRRWRKNFDEAAPKLGKYFATKIEKRSRKTLMKILRDGGWTVQPDFFKNTAAFNDVMAATIAENVSLIKSIPVQFHTQIEGMVMRSAAAGRDLYQLRRDLQKQFGVTRRRAEFIARDQNNKATAAITRVRYMDMGITEAIWLHSAAGKTKRPTHVANSGKKFNVDTGWFDPDPKVRAFIQPGYLINCRCVCKPVVKGFS